MDDVLINKITIIERCLQRIAEEYQGDSDDFRRNFTKQDSVILNLQRACEASIDIANRCLKLNQGPVPQSSRDSFVQLQVMGILTSEQSVAMQKMVGLRNIAVHDYQNLNLDIVIAVVEQHLDDFRTFVRQISLCLFE
ncbi:hypothetical protein CSW98_08920 [Vibrio sp. HA2012]|uniref:type VII toxin-antitoxin system HepT family RNase toxin n=1 Tax=Vibrio sp. HA2012 TaxID=1971595 RepID=UPI000C2BB2A0|nr:DUF86 domain-containing protein [Vibrio sp. HA2012]PJC86329.1 hypothetical protein CSW98_08920 [Vibrio sp. HA2012]